MTLFRLLDEVRHHLLHLLWRLLRVVLFLEVLPRYRFHPCPFSAAVPSRQGAPILRNPVGPSFCDWYDVSYLIRHGARKYCNINVLIHFHLNTSLSNPGPRHRSSTYLGRGDWQEGCIFPSVTGAAQPCVSRHLYSDNVFGERHNTFGDLHNNKWTA